MFHVSRLFIARGAAAAAAVAPIHDCSNFSDIRQHVHDVIATQPVVACINGSRTNPIDGKSRGVLAMLDALNLDYTTIDVSKDANVRAAVMGESQWPSVPQVFLKGNFLGGHDIIVEGAESGALPAQLARAGIQHQPLKF